MWGCGAAGAVDVLAINASVSHTCAVTSAGAVTVSASVTLSVWVPEVARTSAAKVPVLDGTPLTSPAVLSVRPSGRAPLETCHV